MAYHEATKRTKAHEIFSVQKKFVNLRDLRDFVKKAIAVRYPVS